jgi:asparagine synthase (glutamine-hydrolysing)
MADKRDGVAAYLSADIVDRVLARRLPTVLQTNTPAERTLAFADHHIPSRCTYYSIMAARHGVAVSFPLLDRRVVDFILSLPVQMFLHDGQSRQPFRAAMHGILPDSVRLARHKVGLFDDRFTRYAECRAELLKKIAALRATPSPVATEMFDLGAIQAGLEKLPGPERAHLFVRASPSTLAGGMPVWSPLMAVLFLRAAWRLSTVPPGEGARG